jgi:hypothetical protein
MRYPASEKAEIIQLVCPDLLQHLQAGGRWINGLIAQVSLERVEIVLANEVLWLVRLRQNLMAAVIIVGARHLRHVPVHPNASITLLIAGCFRFLTLTQCFDRPA